MKLKTTKKLFAFIIATMTLSCFTLFASAQICKPGYVLVCNSKGKHCKCERLCPRTGCLVKSSNKALDRIAAKNAVAANKNFKRQNGF